MIKQILYMSVMWTTLIFIGYNLLTAEATTTEESKIKDVCKKMDGEWKDSECKFEDGVEMGKPYSKEQYQVDFEHYISDKELDDYYYEEKAAKEDDICDNEDADTTDIKLCMSEDRLQQAAFNIGKEECKEANGEWKKDRCTYYEDEQQEQEDREREQTQQDEPVIVEDWRNEVEPIEDVKISSPFLMVPIDKDEDDEKEIDEKVEKYIADYNEKEEETNEALNADVEEEEEEEESEDKEEESDNEGGE